MLERNTIKTKQKAVRYNVHLHRWSLKNRLSLKLHFSVTNIFFLTASCANYPRRVVQLAVKCNLSLSCLTHFTSLNVKHSFKNDFVR